MGDHDREGAHPAATEAVSGALEADPNVRAVVLINPTEYGTTADVAAVADLCHPRRVIPLLVDEAWGEDFGFHPAPPTAAVQAGADLAVQSLHKADGGLCQASMILVGGGPRRRGRPAVAT